MKKEIAFSINDVRIIYKVINHNPYLVSSKTMNSK